MAAHDAELVADALDQVIESARQIDFDLLREQRDAVASLIVRARYLAELTVDADPFDISLPVMVEMRRRRNLE